MDLPHIADSAMQQKWKEMLAQGARGEHGALTADDAEAGGELVRAHVGFLGKSKAGRRSCGPIQLSQPRPVTGLLPLSSTLKLPSQILDDGKEHSALTPKQMPPTVCTETPSLNRLSGVQFALV